MALYRFEGKTYQLNLEHPNLMVAIKIDENGSPIFDILDQTFADAEGNFTLEWADWAGRIAVLAVDDNAGSALDCVVRDWKNGEVFIPPYETIILNSNPIRFYRFDETTGSVAADSSTSGLDGTLFNSPDLSSSALVTGSSSAISFNGIDQYLNASRVPATSQTFSLEFALKMLSDTDQYLIHTNNDGGRDYGMNIQYHSGGRLKFIVGDGSFKNLANTRNAFSTIGGIQLNTTHHVAIVFSGLDSVVLYIDGVPETISGWTGDPISFVSFSGGSLRIGNHNPLNGEPALSFLNAEMDEFAVYDHILTQSDIDDRIGAGF